MTKILASAFLSASLLLPAAQAFAQDDSKPDLEAIKAELEEAKRLLAKDKANFDATAEKKRLIDEKLAARKLREAEIRTELVQLCEEQEKVSAGSLEACMAKLGN